jgi:hypothetical protein
VTNVDVAVAGACEHIPGLRRGALVLLPEGYVLGAVGDGRLLDLEPLIRSAGRCLGERETPALRDQPPAPFVEYLFVIHDQLVVIQGGRRDARLALALVCTREANLAFVLSASRAALRTVESAVDLAAWGL